MGIDKRKAQKGKWRIPEKSLFLIALALGSVGSILGMYTFRHKTRHKSFVIGMPLILLLQLLLAGMLLYQDMTKETTYTGIGMGTVIVVDAYGRDSGQAADDIAALVTDLDEYSLSWRKPDSALAHINDRLLAGESVQLSAEERSRLEEILNLCRASDGALDITLRPVLDLWGIEGDNPTVPDEKQLQTVLNNHTGYEKLHITEDGILSAEDTGCMLDLGALGKGIACDEIRERLENMKITGAVVSVGGSILTYGKKPDGASFKIGIQDPRGEQGSAAGYLTLGGDMVVSTSGDYEKYFMDGDKRYHHIIDPETGCPADSGVISVTVVSRSGMESDGLSTACFVLGRERSQELLKQYDAEAIFITEEKQIYISDGLKDAFQLINEDYEIMEE